VSQILKYADKNRGTRIALLIPIVFE